MNKKLIALVLAFALVFSSFTAAFADTTTAIPVDAQAAKDLGMLVGKDSSGVTVSYLNETPTRLQSAIMFLRLKGLEQTALSYTSTNNFADANEVAWVGGKNIMAYLKNNPELGWAGVGGNKLNPNGLIDSASYYKVMLESLGYAQGTDFEWSGIVAFAAQKGLVKVANDTNFIVADVATATIEALKVAVKGGTKTLATTLVETGVINEAAAILAGVYTKAPIALAVDSVKVVSAKSLEVKFNKAIADITAVKFAVKRGAAVVTLTPAFNADKTVATLSSAVNLATGDYTITVSGVDFAVGKNVGAVTVSAEKETTLTIISNTVEIKNPATIKFEVKNQYGELMTVSGTAVVANAFEKTDATPATGAIGAVVLTGVASKSEVSGNFAAAHVKNNDEILVTISYKGLVVTKTIKAQDVAAIAKLELGGPVLNANKTRFSVGETVKLDYTALDQYSQAIKLSAQAADGVNDDKVIFATDYLMTSSNPSVVDVDSIFVDADGKMNVVLGAAGTAKLIVINTKTGAVSTTDVVVEAVAAPSTITLTAPTVIVAATETVKIPYTVVDQYGVVITPANLNTANVVLTSSNNAVATVAWVGKEIVVTGQAAGTVDITATVGTTITKFSMDVQAAAVPTKVVGIKDMPTKFENLATVNLTFANILVKDQYNRDYTLVNGDVVTVTVKDLTANGVTNALVGAGNFDLTTESYTFTGTTVKDNEVYTIAINGVVGSGYDVTMNSIATADIVSYEMNTIGTIFAVAGQTSASTHAVEVKIVGKTAAGDKVALVSGKITNITTSNGAVINVDQATNEIFGLDAGTSTIAVWNGSTKLTEAVVTASEAAKVITSAIFANVEVNALVADGTVTNALTLKDQYGVAIALSGAFSSSNTAVATVAANGTVTIVAAGEATIGYVAPNGVVATYKLIVQ